MTLVVLNLVEEQSYTPNIASKPNAPIRINSPGYQQQHLVAAWSWFVQKEELL
jgi:hypothetical protein